MVWALEDMTGEDVRVQDEASTAVAAMPARRACQRREWWVVRDMVNKHPTDNQVQKKAPVKGPLKRCPFRRRP